MRKKIAAANWKMNLNLAEGEKLVNEIISGLPPLEANKEVVLAPPFLHLPSLAVRIQGQASLKLAAQNCYSERSGAYTGEISPTMLVDAGVQDVILGHSERRSLFHETAGILSSKVNLALQSGLRVIFCCGEPLDIRENGKEKEFVEQQIKDSLFPLTVENLDQLVIAYEPIWAIGTGRTASPEQAQEMHAHIREVLHEKWGQGSEMIPLLYGGSVKPDNAHTLFSCPDIDGGLVGGASLNSEDFLSIIKALPH